MTGASKNALVIGADVLSKITDWSDRNTCVLFGDGAGAVILSNVEGDGVLSNYLRADGSGGDLLYMPGGGSRNPATGETVKQKLHYIKMNGNEVFKFAVRAMNDAAEAVLKEAGLSVDEIDLMIPHQANKRIVDAAAKRLDITPEKIYVNLNRYGNMSGASIPVALDEAVKEGKIKKGDYILMVGFGAGLTWGASLVKWNY
jgi:3-oxoacyl-[acyl-carrier-protein] synthase-3